MPYGEKIAYLGSFNDFLVEGTLLGRKRYFTEGSGSLPRHGESSKGCKRKPPQGETLKLTTDSGGGGGRRVSSGKEDSTHTCRALLKGVLRRPLRIGSEKEGFESVRERIKETVRKKDEATEKTLLPRRGGGTRADSSGKSIGCLVSP